MVQVAAGLIALSVLTGFLALLLEVADSYFADYGEVQIDINQGDKVLTVAGGDKLLSTLMDQRIFIPSACGGRGSCGLCKVKVTEGGGPTLPTETPYLEDREIAEQVRLSCQIKVREDIRMEIPPELFLVKEFQTRVVSLQDLTSNIREVQLELSEPTEIEFKPGQYIHFEVPEYKGSPEPIYRAYSIASRASDNHRVRLVITRVPDGLATTYVHDWLKVGDEIRINGPYGDFYLRESDRDVVMIATGSGLAPIMSILYQMVDEGSSRKATVFFGVAEKRGLFYLDEIEEIKKKLPQLEFAPVLSAPRPEEKWEGKTGLVTDAVKEAVARGEDKEAYLCGNPFMIDAAIELLPQLGITEERIFYDKFG
jgi:Na+-transporting NADH:ubiquinone oxidoreductase subunit F